MIASARSGPDSFLQPPWSSMTLTGLVAGAAKLRPDSAVLADGPNTESLIRRGGRELTCGGLKAAADRLATQLHLLGLQPGDVVLLHLPNTVEAAIALLGVLGAGGIPAPLPVFEDREAVKSAVELTGAAAMITMSSFAGLSLAEKCREAAVDLLSVRVVAAFGDNEPDGVVALDRFEPTEAPPQAAPVPDGSAPCLITFDAQTGSRRALLRSHEQVVALAAAAAGLVRISPGGRLLVTVPPTSVAGAVLGLVLPLLTGARVDLVPLFDSCAFAAQIGGGEATHVVLPGPSESVFRQFCEENAVRCEGIVFVQRPKPSEPSIPVPEAGHVRCIDALCLGEALVTFSERGAAGEAGQLARVLNHPVDGVLSHQRPFVSLDIDRQGELHVAGPTQPFVLSGPARLACPTGFAAVHEDSDSIRLVTRRRQMSDAA